MRLLSSSHSMAAPLAMAILAGCAGSTAVPQTAPTNRLMLPSAFAQSAPALPSRIVVGVNYNNGNLEYWPVVQHGGVKSPIVLVKGLAPDQPINMAANGKQVIVTDGFRILLYDLGTKRSTTLPDQHGVPLDVAIGRDKTIYATNFFNKTMNVVVYPPGRLNPVVLNCPPVEEGSYIAVDNESDIFINGYSPASGAGVWEFAHGSNQCAQLKLRAVMGYGAGIAVDPKTDSLLVLDNPDQCAGGLEGRLLVYPKPYRPGNAIERDLGGNCTGDIRLNADSTELFYGDETGDGGSDLVREAPYPFGNGREVYSGGNAAAFTTIPNTLPN